MRVVHIGVSTLDKRVSEVTSTGASDFTVVEFEEHSRQLEAAEQQTIQQLERQATLLPQGGPGPKGNHCIHISEHAPPPLSPLLFCHQTLGKALNLQFGIWNSSLNSRRLSCPLHLAANGLRYDSQVLLRSLCSRLLGLQLTERRTATSQFFRSRSSCVMDRESVSLHESPSLHVDCKGLALSQATSIPQCVYSPHS